MILFLKTNKLKFTVFPNDITRFWYTNRQRIISDRKLQIRVASLSLSRRRRKFVSSQNRHYKYNIYR